MKKMKYIFIGLALTFILAIGIYALLMPPKFDVDNMKTVTLITLPSPPKSKIVNDTKDIKKCVDYINSLTLSPAIYNKKGWWFEMKIDGKTTITFYDQYVSINGIFYKIKNKDYEAQLRDLYNSLNYKEGDWVEG